LVENAIKHNIISDEQPLKIELQEDNDYFIVKNNLQLKRSIPGNSRIGLENLTRRYEYLSAGKVEIIEDGREFAVKLPKLEILKS